MRILDQILGLFLDGCVAASMPIAFWLNALSEELAETGVGHRIGKTARFLQHQIDPVC